MSSLVSLRSYQRRRKSAGARLESVHADGVPEMPPGTASGSGHGAGDEIPVFRRRNFREKRVKSARETRRDQEASDIFPELEKSKVDPEWGKTKYSEDFGPKKIVSPVHIRPISPTRMNNPHPSKEFLTWKHPTRIHEHRKATQPPPDIWHYLQERFYDDYWDIYNTGDAKNEVPITNLAKIKFPGKSLSGPNSTINGISGKKAPLNPRQSFHGINPSNDGENDKILRPPSPQSLMMHHTLKANSLHTFKEWLKSATSKERDVLLRMLQAGHDDSEEVRLNRVVNDVLQSESAERVQDWLKTTNPSERQIVLHVLETLAVATGEGDVYALTYPALYPRLQHRHHHHHHRHHTFPLSLQGGTHSGLEDSRHRSSTKHSSAAKKKQHSSASRAKKSGHTLDSCSQMGLVGKKIVKPEKPYDENPALWQNRILKKKLGTSKIHPAGIFNQPKRDIGQHFAIHPEWPTA